MSDERGYTLVELIMVLALLGVVVGALTTLFVGGTRAEVDLSNRFQAQNDAVSALDRLRRDVHCASSATAVSASAVTLAVPCVSGGVIRWCTAGSGSTFTLHRLPAAGACGSSAVRFAEHLTTGSVFAYQAASTDSLAKLRIDLPVRVGAMSPYRLCDILVLRNGVRAGAPGAAVAPC
jgi:prepilin-type N-terminal cleavage/methylation domain-containing protein